MAHIAIDARFLGPEGTGLGRYVESLIRALEGIPSKHRFSVLLRQENIDLYTPRDTRFTKVCAPAKWYSAKEQVVIPRVLRAIRPDLVHFCHFNVPLVTTVAFPCPFVVTIHDVIKNEFSGGRATTRGAAVYALKRAGYRLTMKRAIAKASCVLVPSENTKLKVRTRYRVPREKIVVTPEGCDHERFRADRFTPDERTSVLERLGVTKPYLLYVGNSYPYKNVELILDALPHLPAELSFVNPCARSVFYDNLTTEVAARALDRRVVLPGYVCDDDLAVLYREASLYVFPSFSEGFGLPILEAMAAGLPVCASNASSIPEVGGTAVRYFDPHALPSFLGAVHELLTNAPERARRSREGIVRAQRYSWEKMVRATLEVYEHVLAPSP